MNLLPKITKIIFKEYYCNGILSPTCTCTPYYYWEGDKYYNWLWFNGKEKLIKNKHFDVYENEIILKFKIPDNAEFIIINYPKKGEKIYCM